MQTQNRRPVSEFMSPNPARISGQNSVHEAFAQMEEKGLRHLPVVDEEGLLGGVITDRDIAFALAEFPGKPVRVDQAMTPEPYTVVVDADVSDVLRVMAGNRFGCAIVKDRGENIAGIFTSTDAVRLLAEVLCPN